MYTRKMLLTSLSEQKQIASSLEKMMAVQTVELEECQRLVAVEVTKRNELELRLNASDLELHRQKMIVHHSDQEMRRLEAIIRAMAIINPAQVRHLKKLQPEFRFRERKIVVLPMEEEPQSKAINMSDFGAAATDLSDLTGGDDDRPQPSASTSGQAQGQGQGQGPEQVQAQGQGQAGQSKGAKIADDSDPDPSGPGGGGGGGGVAKGGKNGNGSANGNDSSNAKSSSIENGAQATNSGASGNDVVVAKGSHPAAVSGNPHNGNGTSGGDGGGSKPKESKGAKSDKGDKGLARVMKREDGVLPISDMDRVLLDRVKWLIKRFAKPVANEFIPIEIEVRPEMEEHDVAELQAAIAAASKEHLRSVRKGRGNVNDDDLSDDEEEDEEEDGDGAVERDMDLPKVEVAKPPPKKEIIMVRPPVLRPEGSPVPPPNVPGRRASDGAAVMDPLYAMLGLPVMGDAQPNTSSMLLGIIDFLAEGDVSLFHVDDRRDWIRTVLGMPDLATEAANNLATLQAEALTRSQAQLTTTDSYDPYDSYDDGKDVVEIDDAVDVLAKNDWRTALMRLRTMHPHPANASGRGSSLDDNNQAGILSRIVEMRENLVSVMRTQEYKHGMKVAGKTGQGVADGERSEHEPINVYAGNLSRDLGAPSSAKHLSAGNKIRVSAMYGDK